MEHKWKLRFLVTLGVMYCVSLLLLTIGFFTPEWVLSYSEEGLNLYQDGFTGLYWHQDLYTGAWAWSSDRYTRCYSVGLVSGVCRYPYGDLAIGTTMQMAFFMTMTGLILLYSNAIMLVVAYIFKLFQNPVYISFLAISFGVLYPVASILVLVASIYVEAYDGWQSGFSVILCNIAGALMLLFYIGLRVYDAIFSHSLVKKKPEYSGNVNAATKMKNEPNPDQVLHEHDIPDDKQSKNK